MSNAKSKEELARELRWLRSKSAHDDNRIAALEDQIKGYNELIAINNGIVAAVLNIVGDIELPRDAVTKAMNELEVASVYDADGMCFRMKAIKKEGEGGN